MKDSSKILNKLNQYQLVICDTTLRDGEQAAGIVFANLEKVRIAKLLDEIGVQQIEAGIPAMGGDEKAAVKQTSRTWGWTPPSWAGTGPTRRTSPTASTATSTRSPSPCPRRTSTSSTSS